MHISNHRPSQGHNSRLQLFARSTLFQALEIVNSAYVESPPIQPRLFETSLMVARVVLKDGYKPGMGLGRNGGGA